MKPLNTFLLIAPAALLMLGVFLVPLLFVTVRRIFKGSATQSPSAPPQMQTEANHDEN